MANQQGFGTQLGTILEQQFGLGDNQIHTLDVAKDGKTQAYANLGSFANRIDQSAQRSYAEEGWFRTSWYNPKVKNIEVLLQQPRTTVLVKKRAFDSQAENFRKDLLAVDERLLLKATSVLFENKCKQISLYEQLSKIEEIALEVGGVHAELLPTIFGITDSLESFGITPPFFNQLKGVVEQIRKIITYSNPNQTTTFINQNQRLADLGRANFGRGTGVIEFTNITNFNTTVSLNFGGGNGSFSISDPYNLMSITELDIEKAIFDTFNKSYNSSFFQFGKETIDQIVQREKNRLNSVRSRRGANPINFLVNPDTIFSKRIRAIIDFIGFEINFDANIFAGITNDQTIDPSALVGGEVGNQGLAADEVPIFFSIISSLYSAISTNKNATQEFRDFNSSPIVKYVRNKLNLYYKNKLLIQPLDSIHVYIDSRTREDAKIIGGLQTNFSQLGFMQTLNNTVGDLKEELNLFNGYSLEKSIFVGDSFPNWAWMLFRHFFVSDKEGAHVFAGVVTKADLNYEASSGRHTVSVNCSDNTYYFNKGIVNFKPALDVFNGSLFDPLTPFDLQFDSLDGSAKTLDQDGNPQLLPENKELFKSAFLRYGNGPNAGKKATESNYIQDSDRFKDNSIRKFFYDPDGLVYKHKEGIATSSILPTGGQARVGAPLLGNNPFMGQDIFNCLSLLICGEPYNYANYYKAGLEVHGLSRDPTTGQPSTVSYLRSLQTDFKNRNFMYGNFIPFKKISMDEASYSLILSKQLTISSFNTELNDLLRQEAEERDKQLIINSKQLPNAPDLAIQSRLIQSKKIDDLQLQINDKAKRINEALLSQKNITIYGNDVSIKPDLQLNIGGQDASNPEVRRELRRKLNFLTRRLIWQVRANEDNNLLIVDDIYDKDLDIQVFSKQFNNNTSIFSSEYESIAGKITQIQNYFGGSGGLEIFADTQGHIQIRFPQYNRIPSSVFWRMLQTKQQRGIQVYPQFIEELFLNQTIGLIKKIEIIEDEIRLYATNLGKTQDSSVAQFINFQGANSSAGQFQFVSNEDTGRINESLSMIVQSDPVSREQNLNNYFKGLKGNNRFINLIEEQANKINIFGNNVRADIFNNKNGILTGSLTLNLSNEERKDDIVLRLRQKTGDGFDPNQYLVNSVKVSSLDLFNFTEKIAEKIRERQQALNMAAKSFRNLEAGLSLASNDNRGANQLLAPNLFGSSKIPEVFESMIEDETYDDFGLDSGKRYVIKNHQIKRLNISEKSPEATCVSIAGRLDLFVDENQLPGDLSIAGGNGISFVQAVDYDLWRMYGIVAPQTIDLPYLSDIETQLAPMAVSILNRTRQEIFTGTITVAGNEFYQPGEVVYLESKDLLFYVESVNHDFTYGSGFTTTLNVSHGHSVGQYIPTYFDLFGKTLYKNKNISRITHAKNNEQYNQQSLGAIYAPYDNENVDRSQDIKTGPAAKENISVIKKIQTAAISAFQGATESNIPIIELRIFTNLEQNLTLSYGAKSLAQSVYNLLIGSDNFLDSISNTNIGSTQDSRMLAAIKKNIVIIAVDSSASNLQPTIIPTNSLSTSGGDLDQEQLPKAIRAPSRLAYMTARNVLETKPSVGNLASTFNTILNSNNVSDEKQKQIDKIINESIIDCWIIWKNVFNEASEINNPNTGN